MFWGLADKIIPFPVPHPQHGHLVEDFTIRKLIHGHERETFEFFKKRLNSDDVVADIGAHNGEYATFFASKVKEVEAFEPDEVAYKKLLKATRKMTNVTCHNLAISNKEGQAELAGQPGSGINSIKYSDADSVTVRTITLPDKFTWAKIDVEGAEIDVLEGLKRKIKCTLEFSPKNLKQIGVNPEDFVKDIERAGYDWFFIDETGEAIKVTIEDLLQRTKGHCNLFLLPKD